MTVNTPAHLVEAIGSDQIRAWFARFAHRIASWLLLHRTSLLVFGPLLIVASVIHMWNFTGTPGAFNDDEGTYVSQAWAVLHGGTLAHYTYWYDHPPFGWIQIAGWAALTNAFNRYGTGILVGRELVGVYAILTAVLLYALCRKLGVRRTFSAIGAILFLVSPISLFYGRMSFLDDLALPWVVAAMLFAQYARKSFAAVILSGLMLTGAALTKETTAVFIPVVLFMIVQQSPRSMRVRNLVFASATSIVSASFFVLMAVLKGELLPGPGHVSMVHTIIWQLVSRKASGSIFSPFSIFSSWIAIDYYLLAAGLLMMIPVVFRKRYWPLVLAAIIHIALLLRGGYLPAPFVVVLLPLSALLIACGLEVLWSKLDKPKVLTFFTRGLAVLFAVSFIVLAVPSWYRSTVTNFSDESISSEVKAVNWITENVPVSAHKQIVSDDNVWVDLINRGYPKTMDIWYYKLDVDPAVMPRLYRQAGSKEEAWRAIDYIVVPPISNNTVAGEPTFNKALKHSTLVVEFINKSGTYRIYKVDNGTQ